MKSFRAAELPLLALFSLYEYYRMELFV